MYKNDTRKLTKESQKLIRNQATNLFEQNLNYKKIAGIIGIHISTVYKWARLYKDFGKKGLILKKRGVKVGTNSKLTPNQVKTIIKILPNKTPDELDMLFLLWTRRAVQLLIQNLWKILIPIRTIGDYLKRIGFTPQRPLRRAYEQNFKAVQVWLEHEYPFIKEKTKKQKGQIHWADETGIRSDNHYGRGYAPKGKTPTIRINVRRI